MLTSILLFILLTKNIDWKGRNLLFSVYKDANVWPKPQVQDPALGQMSNVF